MTEETVSTVGTTSEELNPGDHKVEAAPVQRMTGTGSTCCPPPEQASCCAPAEKESCCGTAVAGTYGCRSSGVASS